MADLARIKDNVRKMAAQNAPVEHIDGYIASEGVTVDDVRNFQAPSAAEPVPAAANPREFGPQWMAEMKAKMEAGAAPQEPGPPLEPYKGGTFSASTEGSQAGVFGGYDDEIAASMLAPIDAGISALRGEGFDIGKAYTEKQQALDAQKAARRAEHPIASIGGEVAGGLALGGSVRGAPASPRLPAPGAPMSISNRVAPYIGRTGASAVEGAGYGALYGSGEAKPGERIEGAKQGAMVGAATGAAIERAGGALANRAGARQAARNTPPAPTADDLAAQSHALYDAADQANVVIRPQSFDRVVHNARLAAGNINVNLRPNTAGVLDDITALQGQPISLRRLDELRQEVALAMRRTEPQDVRTLQRIQDVIDGFANNARARDITGDVRGFQYIRDARTLWARRAKTEIVNDILDRADVDTGQYTQSGLANTIRREMKTLYKRIQSGRQRGFTDEEVALVRQMARGDANSHTIRLLARFAPRGVVSAIIGPALGGAVGGPIGSVGLPLAGHLAARAADRGALAAATGLRDATARGFVPQLPQLPNRLRPLIPGGVAASTEIGRLLPTSPQR